MSIVCNELSIVEILDPILSMYIHKMECINQQWRRGRLHYTRNIIDSFVFTRAFSTVPVNCNKRHTVLSILGRKISMHFFFLDMTFFFKCIYECTNVHMHVRILHVHVYGWTFSHSQSRYCYASNGHQIWPRFCAYFFLQSADERKREI